MGGPTNVIYLPHRLNDDDLQAIDELAADRSWRSPGPPHDALEVLVIDDVEYELDPGHIELVVASLGWRPIQKIYALCYAKSSLSFHADLAIVSMRLAKMFNGSVEVLVDEKYFDLIDEPSVRTTTIEGWTERLVGPRWLEKFLELDEPRFLK